MDQKWSKSFTNIDCHYLEPGYSAAFDLSGLHIVVPSPHKHSTVVQRRHSMQKFEDLKAELEKQDWLDWLHIECIDMNSTDWK